MYRDSWGTGLFYAQSWALTHFLLVGQQGARKPQLGRFLQAVSSGQPMDTAFTDAFGPDLTVLDRELRAYVQQFQLPAIMLQPEAVNVSADPAPMTEIEVQYLQGDLLARMGAMDLAETYLSKALEIDPTFVPARLSRAELRMMQDRPADALDIASAPDLETAADYYTQFVRAEALRASEKHDAAIAAYTRAIEHRTDAPFAYYGLSMSQLATGHKGAAANFSRCMALRPDPEWYRRRQLETMRLGLDGFVVSDAANYLRLVGWRGDEGTYVLLPAVLTHLRRGEKDQAMESLDDIERHIDAKSWQASLVAFLRGTITAETLVARAKTDDGLLTEAHAYAGIMANIAGAPDVGLKHLEWVKARGRKDYIEYGFALGELRRTRPTKP